MYVGSNDQSLHSNLNQTIKTRLIAKVCTTPDLHVLLYYYGAQRHLQTVVYGTINGWKES